MALPVPTVAQLAAFTGREVGSYTAHAQAALAQATLLLELATGRTEMPTEANLAQLAVNAILEMAEQLVTQHTYAEVNASPFQSETIGSYSYSKGSNFNARDESGEKTGLMWWDLALQLLTLTGGDSGLGRTAGGSILVFEGEVSSDSDGNRAILSPFEREDQTQVGFINASRSVRF